ncbi:MAG: electron transport complex subunit RsxC [Candidatus Omnitrophota bacterium]
MVRLVEHKQGTENIAIERLPLPGRVYLPLSQHLGKACSPLVKIGEMVDLGQEIAATQAHVTSPIHASLSGKVSSICDWPHPLLGRCKAIVIESDNTDNARDSLNRARDEISGLTGGQIRDIVYAAGIVGMGGAAFPTQIKLNPPKPVDSLIINAAECEPYLTGDYRLMIEKTAEIISGIEVIAKCLGVKNVYIAIEDNKPEAIKKFIVHSPQSIVKILKSQYPQGGEKQLIKNVLNREVPQGKLPFDVGVVVQNVATVFAVYEAIYLNKPLYERVVTVTGSCLSNPKNLLARLGTPIKELIDFCGPLKEEPAKIIIGGPMMGVAQYTQDVPVIKSTTGIILLNRREAGILQEESCIRCGACVRDCPAGLMPCLINLASEKEMWQQANSYHALDCIECGLCNYVCPANRRLTQSIKRAKLEVVK